MSGNQHYVITSDEGVHLLTTTDLNVLKDTIKKLVIKGYIGVDKYKEYLYYRYGYLYQQQKQLDRKEFPLDQKPSASEHDHDLPIDLGPSVATEIYRYHLDTDKLSMISRTPMLPDRLPTPMPFSINHSAESSEAGDLDLDMDLDFEDHEGSNELMNEYSSALKKNPNEMHEYCNRYDDLEKMIQDTIQFTKNDNGPTDPYTFNYSDQTLEKIFFGHEVNGVQGSGIEYFHLTVNEMNKIYPIFSYNRWLSYEEYKKLFKI
jgi:hypothetical protein